MELDYSNDPAIATNFKNYQKISLNKKIKFRSDPVFL